MKTFTPTGLGTDVRWQLTFKVYIASADYVLNEEAGIVRYRPTLVVKCSPGCCADTEIYSIKADYVPVEP